MIRADQRSPKLRRRSWALAYFTFPLQLAILLWYSVGLVLKSKFLSVISQ